MTVLYLMMAVSAWLVWRERELGRGRRGAGVALSLFMVQLAANALWTWLFFAWQLGAAAFVEILLLWVLICVTIVSFWRIKPVAAALLLPYLAWVSFAAALTWSIWQANPNLLA